MSMETQEATVIGPQLQLARRVDSIDWQGVCGELDATGHSVIEGLLTAQECVSVAAMYSDSALFRRRVTMERHGYGRGEYQYFTYPLPEAVATLRSSTYSWLAPVANRWHETMGLDVRFPSRHAEFIDRCHAGGQRRPTPLILDYGVGDYNCLHRDLYGEHVFPLQLAVLLSEPGRDFSGGEFVLVEQRPRMQSRVEVVALNQGDAVVFGVHQRPHPGKRGFHRLQLRHGVSRVRSGNRRTLGIIFHDAT